MALEIFKLCGSIFVDNTKANESISKTENKVGKAADTFVKGVGTAAKWGAAIVGGATAAGAAMFKFAETSAATADNVDKMSQKIGISRQSYQELDFVCSQSGTSVDKLQNGMKSLVSAMDGAKSGTASNIEQFQKLGISVTDANGNLRSSEEVMWETMQALQKMDNQTEKARLATELFGKSGTELMPLLNGASGSIEEMRNQAHELGLVMDDELITSGVTLTDTIDQMKRSVGAIFTKLGAAFMPIVEKICNFIIDNLPMIQGMIDRLSPVLSGIFDKLIPPLIDLAEQIFPIIMDLIEKLLPPLMEIVSAILPVITDLLMILLPPLIEIIELILPLILQLIEPLLPLLQPIIQLLSPLIEILVTLIKPLIMLLELILPPLINIFSQIYSFVLPYLQKALEFVANVIENVFNFAMLTIITVGEKVKNAIMIVWNFISNFLVNTWNSIKDKVDTVFNWIKDTIANIMDGIKTVITNVWQTVSSTISNVINGIKDTISNVFNGIKSTVTDIWNNIKSAITEPVNKAVDTVRDLIDRMKGFFNFTWELPKLKMPHFNVSGNFSLNPPTVPSFGIEWYKKAMDNGMIMNEPTIFGVNSKTGSLLAGGEAGSEAVVGTNSLMSMINNAVSNQNNGNQETLELVLKELKKLNNGLYSKFVDALTDGVRIDVDNREIMRLVKRYG